MEIKRKDMRALKRTDPCCVNGKWGTKESLVTVRLMAVAEGWAMVRHPGAVPFVVRESDLSTPIAATPNLGD